VAPVMASPCSATGNLGKKQPERPTGFEMAQAEAQSDPKPKTALVLVGRYGFAVVCVATAVGLGFALLTYIGVDFGRQLLSLAIAIVAWYAGVGPSVLGVLLSTVCYDYFFTPPLYVLNFTSDNLPHLLVFAGWATVVAWFVGARRRIEEDLHRSRNMLQVELDRRAQQARLLDQTHDSIIFRQLDGRITYWNRGAQELYGWRAEEAVGKLSHDLLRTVFPVPIKDIDAELLRAGVWEGELEHRRIDGTKVIVASRWSLSRDDAGRSIVMATSNDITERKHREDEVRKLNQELARRAADLDASNKQLESFAYSVSHDLRAPLRHMIGYSELLQKQASSSLDEKSRRYMQMILEASKRMGNLIDDLLAFSRIGRAEARMATVSFDQLVHEVVAETALETKGREIVWKIGPLPICYGDPSMLKLVVANLVSNAVKFTHLREKAEIEIGCIDNGEDEVEIYVTDNGAGFDMQYANKLFGVFQRLHRAEEFEGTGIGLATVQRIIHRHGGKVRAKGVIDQGARFCFSLPRRQDRRDA
jgi:PAS domain S-box-containing protein